MPNHVPAAAPGLPADTLHEIHDCLALALDAVEAPASASLREAVQHQRAALRLSEALLTQIGGAA